MLNDIVNKLLQSYHDNPDLTNMQSWHLPSRECVTDLTHKLESLLYPGLIDCIRYGSGLEYAIGNRVAEVHATLCETVAACLVCVRAGRVIQRSFVSGSPRALRSWHSALCASRN